LISAFSVEIPYLFDYLPGAPIKYFVVLRVGACSRLRAC